MFNRMFDMLDDFDTKKVMEVVNLVWNNRERFIDLIENLPDLLRNTGDSIESAGQSAVKASLFLTGGDNDGMASARQISDLAANALERCNRELRSVAKTMDGLGQEIDDVQLPTMQPTYTEIMGINVISGVEMDEYPMPDNAATRLKEGSDRIQEIGKDLEKVAQYLRQLGGALTETGGDLNNVGVQLKQSGNMLRSMTKFGD